MRDGQGSARPASRMTSWLVIALLIPERNKKGRPR